MARNKLTDLNDHLFAQLERLNDEETAKEDMNHEIAKAKAISGIANQIINTNKLTLEAMKLVVKNGGNVADLSDKFGVKQLT